MALLNCLDRAAHDGLKLEPTFDYTLSRGERGALQFVKADGASKGPGALRQCRVEFRRMEGRGATPEKARSV